VVLTKPGHVFDRDREWAQLTRFAEQPEPGAKLGLVYGRRRQGKTFLLASLVEAAGGFLFGATQQSSAQNLRAFSDAYARYLNRPSTYFSDWDAAIDALWRLGEDSDRPLPVVIDEFSYLADSVPGIASVRSPWTPDTGHTRTAGSGSSSAEAL
jgi:AAA+ ATPase superfamily predicted ATPase